MTEYRQWLVQAHHEATRDFDRAIITLASGALGLSTVFLANVETPTSTWLIRLAWVALMASLLTITASFLSSQLGILTMIGCIDGGREPSTGAWGKATRVSNLAAGSSFVLGVLLLVGFAWANL